MTTVGAKIDALHKLREDKKALEEQVKTKEQEISEAEAALMLDMDAQQVSKATGTKATVSLGTKVRYTVEDWDAYYNHIHRNKAYHLLERRPAQLACEELFSKKGVIPGVVPFTQRKLNFRTVT